MKKFKRDSRDGRLYELRNTYPTLAERDLRQPQVGSPSTHQQYRAHSLSLFCSWYYKYEALFSHFQLQQKSLQLTKFLAKFREKEREEAMVGWWVWYIPGDIMLHVIYDLMRWHRRKSHREWRMTTQYSRATKRSC